MGLFLQLVHQPVQPGQPPAHPLEDPPDIHQYEGHGQHIPDDGGQIRRPHRQAPGHAEGDASPQLHHGHHRHKNRKAELSRRVLRQPLHDIHRKLLQPFFPAAPAAGPVMQKGPGPKAGTSIILFYHIRSKPASGFLRAKRGGSPLRPPRPAIPPIQNAFDSQAAAVPQGSPAGTASRTVRTVPAGYIFSLTYNVTRR